MPVPTTEGTPLKAVTKRRDKRSNGSTDSKKRKPAELDESAQRNKTRSDDKELEKHEVELKRI